MRDLGLLEPGRAGQDRRSLLDATEVPIDPDAAGDVSGGSDQSVEVTVANAAEKSVPLTGCKP